MKKNKIKVGGKAAFLVTKPLQLIVAETIAEQYSKDETILLFVNCFSDFNTTLSRVKNYGYWGKVVGFESKKTVLDYLLKNKNVNKLYLDSDVGFENGINLYKLYLLSVGRISQFVYEEGIGTYRKDLYPSTLIKNCLKILGMGTFFGGHYLTKKIYVYRPDDYFFDSILQPSLQKIDQPLKMFVQTGQARYKYYFELSAQLAKIKGESLIIYLTSWEIDWDFVREELDNLNADFKMIKPHPHIKDSISSDSFDYVIPNKVPIEFYLSLVGSNFNEIIIYHHGSSIESYINETNLTYINISI